MATLKLCLDTRASVMFSLTHHPRSLLLSLVYLIHNSRGANKIESNLRIGESSEIDRFSAIERVEANKNDSRSFNLVHSSSSL